jgi:DNA invertase Pin-like site-specific DNA recombinase
MKLGYARRSPLEKDFAQQVKALKQAGCQKIYKDPGIPSSGPP